MDIQQEIKKVGAKNTLTKNSKTGFDSKLAAFNKITFLTLTNQNETLGILSTYQKQVQYMEKAKFRKFS